MTPRRLAAGVLALSTLLAACGGDGDDEGTTGEVRAVSDPATPVEASIGDVVEISLEANPSTGFEWELAAPPETAIIRFLGGDFEPRSDSSASDDDDEESSRPVVGVGGVQRMRFQVVGAGATTIQLRYVQPWVDPPAPAATSSFTVRVRTAVEQGEGDE